MNRSVNSRWVGLLAATAAATWSAAALACESDTDCKGDRICVNQTCVTPDTTAPAAPPPATQTPPTPPPEQPPPPPGPPPPPPVYAPGPAFQSPPPPPPPRRLRPPLPLLYYEGTLAAGMPILEGDSFSIGGGGALHLMGGFNLTPWLGMGLDFSAGYYGASDGSRFWLSHFDLGIRSGPSRFAVGVGLINDQTTPDVYYGYFWRLAQHFELGLGAEYLWDFATGTQYFVIGLEFGLDYAR